MPVNILNDNKGVDVFIAFYQKLIALHKNVITKEFFLPSKAIPFQIRRCVEKLSIAAFRFPKFSWISP